MENTYQCVGCKRPMKSSEDPKIFKCEVACVCESGYCRSIPLKNINTKNVIGSSQVYQCCGCKVLMDPSECVGDYEKVKNECGKGTWNLIEHKERETTVIYPKC